MILKKKRNLMHMPRIDRGRWLPVVLCGVIALITTTAGAQIRVLNYNIAQLQGNLSSLDDVLIAAQDDDKPGFSTPVSVFIFQEVKNANYDVILQSVRDSAPPGVLYSPGTYTNWGEDGSGGAQMIVFRSGFLFEISSAHDDISTGAGRYTDRWKLHLTGYESPSVNFYVYSSHLKAGDSPSEEAQRNSGVLSIRNNADSLPYGTHIIYAGDMNFYHNGEDGYNSFFNSGNGLAFDPLGTGSWGGSSYAIKHTQSPRRGSSGGLVGGGMDDRFDFQLSTLPFHDADGLAMIGGTYRAFGNDGQHYNGAINNGNNFYYPSDIPRSNALADDLHEASDHIPVMVEYQIPAIMLVTAEEDLGKMIQGTAYLVSFFVSNEADVDVAEGADELNYTATGTGDLIGPTNGSVEALAGAEEGFLVLDTSQVGSVGGTLTVTGTSEDVQGSPFIFNPFGAVVRPANASFSDTEDLNDLNVPDTYEPDTGVQYIDVDIHNFGYDADQALLDVDAVSAVSSPFTYVGGLASGIGDTPATLAYSFDTTGLPDDLYEEIITIDVSDEDIPGETTSDIQLTLAITIGGGADCPEDITGDSIVNIDDIFAILGLWGTCPDPCPPYCTGDLTEDCLVNIDDIFAILGGWGICP